MNSTLDRVEQPWVSSPYSLISWWDMEQFSAKSFFWAGYYLESIRTDCLLGSSITDPNQPFYNPAKQIDSKSREMALKCLIPFEKACQSVGLELSAGMAGEVKQVLQSAQSLNYQWLEDQVDVLKKLIASEMGSHGFFYISPARGRYWPRQDQRHPFGDAVAESFASTHYDAGQAAICLAIGLGTASVFHLMRVVEIGLGALGSKFGVSLAHTNWAPAIDQIESQIREIHKDPVWKALPDCKALQERYAQAASYMGILKDAWRNYTMHSRGKFTEDEAELLFLNVKGFLQKLAELGLKE